MPSSVDTVRYPHTRPPKYSKKTYIVKFVKSKACPSTIAVFVAVGVCGSVGMGEAVWTERADEAVGEWPRKSPAVISPMLKLIASGVGLGPGKGPRENWPAALSLKIPSRVAAEGREEVGVGKSKGEEVML